MSCGALQRVRESLGLGEIGGTPVEIDHALILCRLVGPGHRSAQQLSFEHSKLVSLPQPDHHREIWKTRHALISLSQRLLDSSQRVRLSIDVGFQFGDRLPLDLSKRKIDLEPFAAGGCHFGNIQARRLTLLFALWIAAVPSAV